MSTHPVISDRHTASDSEETAARSAGRGLRRITRWEVLLSGAAALAWLLLRTGSKPSRITYPCQQAAFSAATLAFGATVVGAMLALRRTITRRPRQMVAALLALIGLAALAATWDTATVPGPQVKQSEARDREYRASVFHVRNCPQDPVGDRFVGLDNLLALMGREGCKLYQSPRPSLLAGPGGIVAPEDVVIIKINYQWSERGGTNVDLLRGMIHRLLAHPDGFSGEIIVCENAQFAATNDFNRSENNAQDISLSPRDVVDAFRALGAPVSHFDWTGVRGVSVAEYSAGDMSNGYVVYPYDARWQGRLSYPKFQTTDGTYVSLRDGIWNAQSATYDRARLKLINLPVLKSHHAVYGLTGCVKHFMGVVTNSLSTNAHGGVGYGALGALMGEIGLPDLNILDCIWVSGSPYEGPSNTYENAVRRDELVASLDPVAADVWAGRNILIPAFVAGGFSPPWPAPSADPDDPAGKFRQYLDASMNYLLTAGHDVTNDPARIDAWSATAQADNDRDGDVDLREFAAVQVCAGLPADAPPSCADFDFDSDGALSGEDFAVFAQALTGPADAL